MPTPLFKKGQKPGPGRPKGSTSHIDWCEKYADGEGKTRLIELARSKSEKIAMQAVTLIFAYGKGKPKESMDVRVEGLDQLADRMVEARKRAGK